MEATNHHPPPPHWNDRKFKKPRQPVVDVSWFDAVAYCQWAAKRLPLPKRNGRKPQGTVSIQKEYPWGDESPKRTCRFWSKAQRTAAGGQLPTEPNSAYTIVQVAFGSGATIGTNPIITPLAPYEIQLALKRVGARVLRGGAWNNKRNPNPRCEPELAAP